MGGLSDDKAPTLGPWPTGIDNLNQEEDTTSGDKGRVTSLRGLVNMDNPRSGWPETRPGRAKVIDLANGHSGWHGGHFPYILFADGDTQYAWAVGNEPFPVLEDLAVRDISYALPNDKVYCSNGQQAWCVNASGVASDWAVETPAGLPVLTAVPNGGLDAGLYQVTFTFLDAFGEEGGAPLAAIINLPDKCNIGVANIPTPVNSNVARVRAYVTPTNGDKLYMARDIGLGVGNIIIGPTQLRRPLSTLLLSPMPAGDIVRHMAGRLYVAKGKRMYWSEALRYGLTDDVANFRDVGDRIDLMECVGDGGDAPGVYVSDYSERTGKGRTYWFGGADPHAQNYKPVSSYGAVPGTGCIVPAHMFGLETSVPVAYWLSRNGQPTLGLPGGQLVVLKPGDREQAVAPSAVKGSSLFRERNGIRHIITTLKNPTRQDMAIGDKATAKVYRNGVVVQEDGAP